MLCLHSPPARDYYVYSAGVGSGYEARISLSQELITTNISPVKDR